MIQAQRAFANAVESIATGIQANLNPADSYVATGLDTSIRSARQAMSNAEMGYNFTAMADSTLDSVTGNLHRIRELALQAANGVYSDSQISAMQAEIDQNVEQIRQTFENSDFNGKKTVNAVTPEDSSVAPTVNFMVGANSTEMISYNPNIELGSMNFDVSSPDAAAASLAQVDTMLNNIGSKRGEIGAVQTSFEGAIQQQSTSIMSYASSLSGIQDTDIVTAVAELQKAKFSMEAMGKVMKAVMNSERYVLDLIK